jgi:GTPase SAR1 family protein
MVPNFYRRAAVALILFAFDEPSSYISAQRYLQSIDNFCDESCIKIIVGNKADLKTDEGIKAMQSL